MEEFLKKYNTSKEGLSSGEVSKRQNENGLNELQEKKKKSPVVLFLEQFVDVLIALLIVAAIAAYFVGDVIDSCVILIAVLLNTIIGFIQEYRSEKAIEMLKSVTTSHAVVRRDGQVQKIDSKELTIEENNYLDNLIEKKNKYRREYDHFNYLHENDIISKDKLYELDLFRFGCDFFRIDKIYEDHPMYNNYVNSKNYWINWWGHNRENIPKGFLNLVVDYGGLNDI